MTAVKLVVVYHAPPIDSAKVVFVAKDAGITKGVGLDPAQINATFDVSYGNGAAAGTFTVPAGVSFGTTGWVANKPSVAKFLNRAAPAGPTGAKIAIVKPGTLLKLVGKSLGDVELDVPGQGDPGPLGVSTVFTVTNGAQTNRHCSHFSACTYTELGAGTGAKLVCRPGTPAACP